MIIHSYYEHVPGLTLVDEYRLALLWIKTWRQAGFEPVILNRRIAMKHPYYEEMAGAIAKLPTVNPVDYEFSCYLRHLALVQAGGGWMADLDVMPLGDKFEAERVERFVGVTVLQAPCIPSLLHAPPEAGLWLCQQFANSLKEGLGLRPQGDRPHYSDQYAIGDLLERGRAELMALDVVRQFGDSAWEYAPFVHYSAGSMAAAGKVPKWKWIPRLNKKPDGENQQAPSGSP